MTHIERWTIYCEQGAELCHDVYKPDYQFIGLSTLLKLQVLGLYETAYFYWVKALPREED